MHSQKLVRDLIEATESVGAQQEFPNDVNKILTFSPEIGLELMQYYMTINENEYKKEEVCLRLILRCLDQLRYDLDKKSEKAIKLFHTLQDKISLLFQTGKANKLAQLNAIIYESHLPFVLEINENLLSNTTKVMPDIIPKFPEFLEQIRREHRIRSSFDLYDGLMSQLQMMPADVYIPMVSELAMTKKDMPHEVAVMMLLNPKSEVRTQIIKILTICANQKVFTPLDLRRLIVIRNWIPSAERPPIDDLIKSLRLQGVSPAPYPITKIDTIMASTFDGAGAQLILFGAKQGSNRIIGGFILKHDIGIREPWVDLKAAKGEIEGIVENSGLVFKPITINYVNKAVRHFIADGHGHGNIPSPFFLQIAEILGATEWQPELIDMHAELSRLADKIDDGFKTKEGIQASLDRSGQWHLSQPFFKCWFECGETAKNQLLDAIELHKKLGRKTKISLEEVVTQKLIEPAINKWKTMILFMCLWARSKSVKEPLWIDLFILAGQLAQEDIALADIPAIKNIAAQSAASMFMHVNLDKK